MFGVGAFDINTDKVSNILKKNIKCLTIIGEAGSGKSTLMKHLFLQTIREGKLIPIFIELRQLNSWEGSINKYIEKLISSNRLTQNEKILERFLEKGKFIFFFDGYDELNNSRKNNIIEEIKKFVDTYQKNKYIITSRPHSNIEFFAWSHNYEIKKLDQNDGDIEAFVKQQLKKGWCTRCKAEELKKGQCVF